MKKKKKKKKKKWSLRDATGMGPIPGQLPTTEVKVDDHHTTPYEEAL